MGHLVSMWGSDFSCPGVRRVAVLERRGWALDAKPRQYLFTVSVACFSRRIRIVPRLSGPQTGLVFGG